MASAWFAITRLREDAQTLSFRGRRSRNKVSVGEPAEGSLSFLHPHPCVRLPSSLSPSWSCRPRGRCGAKAHPASADPRVSFPCESSLRDARSSGSGRAPPRDSGALRSVLGSLSRESLGRSRVLEFDSTKNHTTLVDGYLGMSNDEERSEMRYVVRIAEFSESSKL